MKNVTKKTSSFIAILVLITILVIASETIQVNATESKNIIGNAFRGALLYDNWIAVLEQTPPEGNSPLWGLQDTNKLQGASTWRCQECHGWDYKGIDGAFANGNHVTGFKGIQNMIGKTHEEVYAFLDGTNKENHNFSLYMDEKDLNDLVAFIRTKQIDLSLVVNYETREILGHQENGALYFAETCQQCHGENAQDILVKHQNMDMFISDLAIVDPWQAIHHVRFSNPTIGFDHSFEQAGLSFYKIIDVLTYVQTLPKNNSDEDLASYNPEFELDISGQGKVEMIMIGGAIILAIIVASWFVIAKKLREQETQLSIKSKK